MATSSFPTLCLFVLLVLLESATMALGSRSLDKIEAASSDFGGAAEAASSQLIGGHTHDEVGGRAESERRLARLEWCVAKPFLGEARYQGQIDWACGQQPGQGQVNCDAIRPGGPCYLPATSQSHASWAFNAYYQTHGQSPQACNFQGAAWLTTVNPSTPTCPYDS